MISPPGTLGCFICGGRVIYKKGDRNRFYGHMNNEHGAVYELDFLFSLCNLKEGERTAIKNMIDNEIISKKEAGDDDDKKEYVQQELRKIIPVNGKVTPQITPSVSAKVIEKITGNKSKELKFVDDVINCHSCSQSFSLKTQEMKRAYKIHLLECKSRDKTDFKKELENKRDDSPRETINRPLKSMIDNRVQTDTNNQMLENKVESSLKTSEKNNTLATKIEDIKCPSCKIVFSLETDVHIVAFKKHAKLCTESLKEKLSSNRDETNHEPPSKKIKTVDKGKHISLQAGFAPGISCDQCDKRFATENRLQKHNLIKHQKQPVVKEELLECYSCDRNFFGKDRLLKHMNDHHRDTTEKVLIEEKKFLNQTESGNQKDNINDKESVGCICPVESCRKVYSGIFSLKRHIKSVHKSTENETEGKAHVTLMETSDMSPITSEEERMKVVYKDDENKDKRLENDENSEKDEISEIQKMLIVDSSDEEFKDDESDEDIEVVDIVRTTTKKSKKVIVKLADGNNDSLPAIIGDTYQVLKRANSENVPSKSSKSKPAHYCDQCNKKYKDYMHLLMHRRKVHLTPSTKKSTSVENQVNRKHPDNATIDDVKKVNEKTYNSATINDVMEINEKTHNTTINDTKEANDKTYIGATINDIKSYIQKQINTNESSDKDFKLRQLGKSQYFQERERMFTRGKESNLKSFTEHFSAIPGFKMKTIFRERKSGGPPEKIFHFLSPENIVIKSSLGLIEYQRISGVKEPELTDLSVILNIKEKIFKEFLDKYVNIK